MNNCWDSDDIRDFIS